MSITVNNNTLKDHLEEEKAKELKEVIYDINIQITRSIYKKPSAAKASRGRSGKVRLIRSEEDIFLTIFDSLSNEVQDLMIYASKRQQNKIWYRWKKANKSGSLVDILKDIIIDVIG